MKKTLWIAAVLLLSCALWHALSPRYDRSHFSPRHVYRLDYYEASWLQRLAHWDMHYPHVIRLYRIQPETLLGESEVVDLWLNGEIDWWLNPPVNAVQVGRDAVFENIPPECTDCPRLPDSAVMP
ncbi:hypothetical protein AVAK2825_07760 [Acidovorax sp. SUPP2825]|nr:hypothetical protein AVAK2825_07760 [Acidovorax sp. SUPP2825]